MRSLRYVTAAIAVIAMYLWTAPPVAAISITDVVDPADTLIAYGSTPSPCPAGFACTIGALTFVHDISDDGYVPGVNTITSATISIHLTDTGGSETYMYTLGSIQTFTSVNVPGGSGSTDPIVLSVPSLVDLEADGKITVKIESLEGPPGPGEFYFADARLTAEVTETGTLPLQVPGPASWLLVATGLAALAVGRTLSSQPNER